LGVTWIGVGDWWCLPHWVAQISRRQDKLFA
jgi:hypothetical protein